MQRNLTKDAISILFDEPSLTTSLFFSVVNNVVMPNIGLTSVHSVCTCQYSVTMDSFYDNSSKLVSELILHSVQKETQTFEYIFGEVMVELEINFMF